MNRNQDIARAVRRALLLSAVAAATVVPAQAQEQSDESIQTVVVTGSNIRRTDEGALPVQVITQEQIQQSGATTAEQFLQTVSIAVQGNTNVVAASGSGASTGGVSTVSLRGLGSQRTLVLVNGKRVSGGGTITDSTSVDVNSIPLAAVQRVEVLKDGASAIYGSDAIAGVINFILRDDYQGAEATAYFGDSSDGGGGIKRVNGVLGFGNLAENRYNVLFVGSYQKEDALFGAERGFSASGINEDALNDTSSGNSFPANVASVVGEEDGGFAGSINPLADNCAPSVESPLFGPGVCRYDPSPFVSLLPDTERMGIYSAATFALTDEVQIYSSLSYNKSEQDFVIQPVPISDQFTIPPNHPLFNVDPYNGASTIILQPSSPYYPTAAVQAATGGTTPDLFVRYRSVITGNRSLTDTIEQPRGVLGIRGTLGAWDFDSGFVYSQTTLTEHVNNGYPSLVGILPLLNSGQVNFFGDNTPEVQALADATQFRGDAYETTTTIQSLSATVSRELFDLPAGALAVAFAAEARKEKFEVDPDATIQTGDISGYGGNFLPIDVSRDVTAFSAELNIPIVKSLEAGLAVRYDDYEGTGNKTVPKASLRWHPVEQVLLRASWGKGFRAPSLTELYQPQLTGVTGNGQNDPARCGVTDGNGDVNEDARDCATQFPIVLGGNPGLVPEESDNLTLGLVFEPFNNVSIGLDAFKIKLKDTIIFGITPEEILGNPLLDGLVTRGAADPTTPGLPGHITNIDQTNLNFGETRVEGVDLDLRARLPQLSFGTFTLALVGSYFSKYEIQNLDGSFRSINGKVSPIANGNGGVVPRWHHYLSLGFNTGPWEAVLSQNFQTGYDDVSGTFEDTEDPAYAPRKVSRYLNYDLQGAYSGIKNTRIALGIRNAFDQDPPYTNAGGQNFFQAGYDPGYADPRGRFFYGTVTYSFK